MNDNDLFLATLTDLETQLEIGNEYSILKATALLRQLLIDGANSLVGRVNRFYRLKILFPVCGRKRAEMRFAQSVEFYAALGAIHTSGSQGDTRELVTLDTFLKTKILKEKDVLLTVYNLIEHSANVLGGVHRGEPKTDKQKILSKWAKLDDGSTISINTSQLAPLIMVVLDGLQELRRAILSPPAQA